MSFYLQTPVVFYTQYLPLNTQDTTLDLSSWLVLNRVSPKKEKVSFVIVSTPDCTPCFCRFVTPFLFLVWPVSLISSVYWNTGYSLPLIIFLHPVCDPPFLTISYIFFSSFIMYKHYLYKSKLVGLKNHLYTIYSYLNMGV